MSIRLAERIADAILYEGYVLYPYRASAAKNRFRWQVGLVAPLAYAEATGADPWFMQTECLVQAGSATALTVRVRFLQVQDRTVEQVVDEGRDQWQRVESLSVDGQTLVTWEEGVVQEFTRDLRPLMVPAGPEGPPLRTGPRAFPDERCFPLNLDGGIDYETVRDAAGRIAARIVRRRWPLTAAIRVATEPCDAFVKLRVRIENLTPHPPEQLASRAAATSRSLAGTHTLLVVEDGEFVSLLDPEPPAATAAASCINLHTWPVLVGAPGSRAVMLSSPIILYDYPEIAPESTGDLCDATEIDEMLLLRVKTLTDIEKREARATDARAGMIVDRADAASAEVMGRLHGAIRHHADVPAPASDAGWETFLNPPDDAPPEAACLEIGATRVARGSRVRLKPVHRADSMDMFLDGRMATVTAIYRTLENAPYVAVALDDDPLAASGARYRRSLFFHPDEIVPLDTGAPERRETERRETT